MLAALLESKGYTGPAHVLEGKEGLVQCLGPQWKLDVLTAGLGRSWRIAECGMKVFPTEALTHTPISAALELVTRNDLRPEQVAAVQVGTTARAADILADPSKYDPRTREPPATRCRTVSRSRSCADASRPQSSPSGHSATPP